VTFDNLLIERDAAVAVVTLNRPDALNALSIPLLTDLDQALTMLAADVAVRAVVITGAGDKAFAAGADIRELAALSAIDAGAHAAFGQRVLTHLEQFSKPVIAAINGFALGGGCELALSCSLRVASETARLGQPEINLGIIPGFGGTQRLPRLIGRGRALDLLLTGRLVTAREALELGLVNRVVAEGDLKTTTWQLAAELASKPAVAIRFLLQAVDAGLDTSLDRGQQLEAALFALASASTDGREGMTAFLQKRVPRFTQP
jgi:enoyl-CoA hydratase